VKKLFLGFLVLFVLLALAFSVRAESKPNLGPGQVIPKLSKSVDAPVLDGGGVYPQWGPPCQRYIYHTTYKDKEGRPPEYVRLYFNGNWIDVGKQNPNDNNYKKGVTYAYEFIPDKISGNFFFFEASNGKGKTREGIIDSPGNGPVLFESDFLHNQIVLIDKSVGKKILDYPTENEWIGGVALSDDGRYLAVKTSLKVILFDTQKPEKPVWIYSSQMGDSPMAIGGDVKGGVAISGDGSKIFASLGDQVILFNKGSNRPVWQSSVGNAYNVAISKDGNYVAAATAGSESDKNTNLMVLWNSKSEKPLWQYHSSGNFHDVSLSQDGKYLAGATGCPDRKAYIFEKSSNKPIMQSEQLTYDSPVSRSKITADGSLAVFNTDGGSNSSMLFLFSKDSKVPVWKFNNQSNPRASRALAVTPDGGFIGVANMTGETFLFAKERSVPLKSWRLNASTAALDIADDGSFLAVGGTDNKVYLLEREGTKTEFDLNEFVQEIDISANGKYIAVGTGGSHYFFEEISSPGKNKVFDCKKIVEPKVSFAEYLKIQKGTGFSAVESAKPVNILKQIILFFKKIFSSKIAENKENKESNQEIEGKCGNTICEPMAGENEANCPKDCSGED